MLPCKLCKDHFKEMIKKYTIRNNNRKELVWYFCFLHNNVNRRLGKPIFDCRFAEIYWGGINKCLCPPNKTLYI